MIDTQLFSHRLGQLIALPSVSCTSPKLDMSNRPVVELLANWLSPLGFDIELMEVADGKANLIATLGSGSGGLVLAGHTDTVPCNPERWQQDPFTLEERDNRFYGLGATDMKGFFPVVLAALDALKGSLNRLQQPLIILATSDEESSMNGARALALAGRPKARYAVIGEPTGMRPIRMHKGIMMEAVRIQGLAGHSSDPSLGHNALETMHAVMSELLNFQNQLKENYRHPGFAVDFPTLNLGHIHGGDNPNRICGHCEIHFDLRPLPGMNPQELRNTLEQRLRPIGEAFHTPLTLDCLVPGIDAYEQQADSELVTLAEKLSGHSAGSVAFATEAPYLKKLGMQTLVMGPGSIDQAHQPNEYMEQSQVTPAVNCIRELITQLCLTPHSAKV
ncbi:acetylornithine deacetylase [Teredinibacter haidensis]|uniref:acetylornithine deacetylase n=1 Tax=Teredinibacter haidensis TaxID=2731755 RepID=UPI000948BD7D|nr:acetylornithine deacetylase [Teredinibacter haidensis]